VPFIVERLLRSYGQKTTLIALAVSFLILIIPTFKYIKSRTPDALVVGPTSIDVTFLRRGPFWILFLANFVQGIAVFAPNIYLPSMSLFSPFWT
jgi:hypothetical protein